MGRHSTGKNNYSLSGGAIAAVIVALLAVIATVMFFMFRSGSENSPAADGNSADSSCVSGDLELPVAATDAEIARTLIDAYSATAPIVRDFCVNPVLVDSVADAAVYIAPSSPVALQQLERNNRTSAAANPATVYSEDIGIAVPEASETPGSFEDINLSSVTFPVDDESAASALVASRLAESDKDAVAALTNQRVGSRADAQNGGNRSFATAKGRVPKGYSFVPLDEKTFYAAIALNQGENVSENQARAGHDFARSAAENVSENSENQPPISESVWAAATPTGNEDRTGSARGNGEILDTLFLLDTSESMAPFLSAASEGISSAARAVADHGSQVALWNYSSPMSTGVTQGFRSNVMFTQDSEMVTEAVAQFLSGGQPKTREAVMAAVEYAATTDGPTRVVVITSGTADGDNNNTFSDAVKKAKGSGVSLSVIHVGESSQDAVLKEAAASISEAARGEEIASAIEAAVS